MLKFSRKGRRGAVSGVGSSGARPQMHSFYSRLRSSLSGAFKGWAGDHGGARWRLPRLTFVLAVLVMGAFALSDGQAQGGDSSRIAPSDDISASQYRCCVEGGPVAAYPQPSRQGVRWSVSAILLLLAAGLALVGVVAYAMRPKPPEEPPEPGRQEVLDAVQAVFKGAKDNADLHSLPQIVKVLSKVEMEVEAAIKRVLS